MIRDDRVCSRGIDNVEVFQKINRPVTGSHVLGYLDVVLVVAILKDVNAISCREDIDLTKVVTEKRIQHRRFARLDLADNHKQEWLAQVRGEAFQVTQCSLGRADLLRKYD